MAEDNDEITQLLEEWQEGSSEALEELLPLVHRELRTLAARYLRKERTGHTLQPTALVHEAWFKLVDQRNRDWQNKSHFLAIAARLMRQVLVEHARSAKREKRGGAAARVTLNSTRPAASSSATTRSIRFFSCRTLPGHS